MNLAGAGKEALTNSFGNWSEPPCRLLRFMGSMREFFGEFSPENE